MEVFIWKVTIELANTSPFEPMFKWSYFGTKAEAYAFATEQKDSGGIIYYSIDKLILPLTKATLLAVLKNGAFYEDEVPGGQKRAAGCWFQRLGVVEE